MKINSKTDKLHKKLSKIPLLFEKYGVCECKEEKLCSLMKAMNDYNFFISQLFFNGNTEKIHKEIEDGDLNYIYLQVVKKLTTLFINGHSLKDGNKRTFMLSINKLHEIIKEEDLE